MKDTLGLIFAYQREELMKALTQKRALSSIPFGGRYRIVDFALSNMVNSGITKVGVITRNSYQSLMDHLGSGKEWDLNRKNDGLYLLPPFNQSEGYRGKMEALLNANDFIRKSNCEYVVLATADNICNMTFDEALEYHKAKEADITIIYKNGQFERQDENEDSTFITTNEDGRVVDVAVNPIVGRENLSMGTIIIGKALLETLIRECASHNMYSFHRDVLQKRVNDLKIYGYEYSGFYAKIDSIASYFEANMDLLNEDICEALFYQNEQIFTKIRDEVPTLYQNGASVKNSLVADGCVIEGEVENCIIGRGVTISKGCKIKDSIILPETFVGEDTVIKHAVVDKKVIIQNVKQIVGNDERLVYIKRRDRI